MAETMFMFKDMFIKIDRPESIMQYDSDIGKRCFERLHNIHEDDKWTKMFDKIILDNNVKYERIDNDKGVELLKQANDITFRL